MPVPIEYTGLREGQKLHEEPFGKARRAMSGPGTRWCPHVPVPPITGGEVLALTLVGEPDAVRQALRDACWESLGADDSSSMRN